MQTVDEEADIYEIGKCSPSAKMGDEKKKFTA